nr:non-ribosomal peptide synthetase/type I polyketide synthase [Myxococcus sp. XM-1-1-1]
MGRGGVVKTAEFIVELQRQGIELWVEGEALRFRAPPGHVTDEVRAALRERKHQLVEHLSATSRVAEVQAAVVPPPEDARFSPFPLTDIQNAYWVGRQDAFDAGGVAAHSYLELAFDALDPARLERVLQRLIAHHDMLRMVVLPTGEQVVLASVPPFRVTTYDLRAASAGSVDAHLAAIRAELSHQVLPADRFPLFEVRASQLPGGQVHVHISLDLLVADAFSVQLLIEQCVVLYQDLEAPLAPLKHTFREYFAAAARRREQGAQAYQRALEYWRGRLATLPGPPELPLAADPGTRGPRRFSRRKGGLEPAAWKTFRERAAAAGVTASMALAAAYGEVLRAHGRGQRLTLNLTLFNRLPLLEDVERIVGDFTSGILLEVDGSQPESFAQRARRLQGQLFDDLEHSIVSSVQVLREAARLGRLDTGMGMPFVFTSLLSETGRSLRMGEGVRIVEVVSQTPQVWLDHQVFELNDALYFSWDSVDAQFPQGLMDALFGAYVRLLRRLVEDPSAWEAPARQPLPAEQLARREAYNATGRPVPSERMETLFLRQAATRPQAPALIAGDKVLTYGALERRSARLASWLVARGARPERLVAIVAEKGPEQVLSALAILRAGAAYLPLDPSLPTERLHELLRDARVDLVLTQAHLDASLTWPEGPRRLAVDLDGALDVGDAEPPAVQGNGLAYVIYTSGSTGRPKGVMIDHQGAVNTLVDINARFGVGPEDRVFALSSLSFDLSVYDVFGTLAAGAAIVMPAPGTLRDPSHWLSVLTQGRVTVWNSVPALMEMLIEFVEGAGQRLPDSLRLVMMSGDWIPVTLPERIRSQRAGIELVSLGGATEASIWSILYRIGEVDRAWRSIPYGHPMVNQRFHVLDDALEPCPEWVAGQLYIGGVGLALGYYGDAERTAARFIVHPRTGERLYATGDLGRFLPDGNIEFLGREDFQVKIQGHRIELGEIEAALDTHPAVRGAVVKALGKPGGPRRLVAYVVPDATIPTHVLEKEPSDATLDEAHEPEPRLGVISDPIARLEFKLKGPGLRTDVGARESIALAKPVLDAARLQAVVDRRSHKSFRSSPVSLGQLSELLSCLMQVQLEDSLLPKYRYASAGGLYPVQVYLHVKAGRVQGLAGGTYYYHPKQHALVLLSPDVVMSRAQHAPGNRATFDDAALSVFLVGQLDAIQPLYGDLARGFCLLEAGYIAQLLMGSAVGGELGLCPIGGLDFEPLRQQLALDAGHVLLHSFLVGGVGASVKVATPATRSAPATSLPEELRRHLVARLPDYMVPTSFVLMDALPLTPNGKVDRDALREPSDSAQVALPVSRAPRTEVERSLATILQEVLHLDEVDIHRNFFDLGGTSVQIVQVHRRLRERLHVDLPIAQMFRFTTVSALAEYVSTRGTETRREPVREAPRPKAVPVPSARPDPALESAIAIVGMSGRFPGARNLAEFWRNLCDGVESVSFFTEEELRGSVLEPSHLEDPRYVRAGAVLDDVELFDAEHFGLMPKQARLTDPQHRIFMECVWEAIEDAGYDPKRLQSLVGVYAGSIISNYLLFHLGSSVGREGAVRDLQTLIGNDKDYLATHVSYRLGLKGPSISVQTACSSSLVAVHLASQALRNRECDMALAGGVAVRLPQRSGYLYEQGGILSPDGHCRAFDADAQGTLFGSGAGVVVLKRLTDALADGDCIRAVIRGSAVNNDGSMKVGYTAPSQEGQAAVIASALTAAGVSPRSIGYIETHGTGTPLGDQIEFAALQQAFGADADAVGVCPIGSVKTNVGHLEVAAGIAGLIKTVLSLQHRRLPPSLNFKAPHPQLDFAHSPFFVNTRLSEWRAASTPRRAGVSSFGIGGTNAHVVLEEAPEVERKGVAERPRHVLALSARSEKALRELAGRYAKGLGEEVGDACFTANTGRGRFAHRVAVVGRTGEELREELARYASGGGVEKGAEGQARKAEEVVLLFTGQGVQHEGMGRELYETSETFRGVMKRCEEVVKGELGESLVEVLYGGKGALLERSSVSQAALFSVEYALSEVWREWGVKPAAVMGHSLGEYVAACVAGVFSLEEGLKLVMERGRLMEGLEGEGKMVAVLASEEEVKGEGGWKLIAAVNGPGEVVLAGRVKEVEEVEGRLKGRGKECRVLKTTHAFHSELMEPMKEGFERAAGKVGMKRAKLELVSNVSGKEVKGEEREAGYWARHLREPVKYWEGVKGLYERGYRVFVEVGPKPTLTGVGKRYLGEGEAQWVGSLRPGSSDWEMLLGSTAKLYVKGVEVDWAGVDKGYARRRVALPTYPFQRERYWVERPRENARSATRTSGGAGLLGRRLRSPALTQTVFESSVGTGAMSFLAEHQVHGATVLPATVYMELARAAAVELLGAGAHPVDGLLIHDALVLRGAAERVLQLVVSPSGDDTYTFQLFSAEDEGARGTKAPSWTLHASGSLARARADVVTPEPRPLSELLARCPAEVPAAKLHAHFDARGIHYGPAFKGLERIRLGQGEALGQVRRPETLTAETWGAPLHPAMLDACLQVCGALFLGEGRDTPEDVLVLPVGLERLVVWSEPGTTCWSHVSMRVGSTSTGDVRILDEAGRVCVELVGLRFQQVSRSALRRILGTGRDWTYELAWEPRSLTALPDGATSGGTWVLLADGGGLADDLAKSLEARGARCVRVLAGSTYEAREGGTYAVDPTRAEDFSRLLQDLTATGGEPCRGIVHLWGLGGGLSAPSTQDLACMGALHLVQALSRGGGTPPPRLWLVTRGTQRTGHETAPPSLAHAALWGLGRTLAVEHPESWGALIDLDGDSRDEDLRSLRDELLRTPEGEQVAIRRGRRYVARLVRGDVASRAVPSVSQLRRDATYLITGGLGALGLHVARWMVERGARHLMLMGRNEASPGAEAALRSLRSAGARIECVRGDVSRPEDVARALATLSGDAPPLRGVMHVAGVVEDATLLHQDWARFERVLAPKQRGSWNLHQQTLELPLDFFVMFSSSASLLGAAGQGNYAAANAFMDALAHHRRALGLSAVSINWGPWSGGGMAAALEVPEARRWFEWIEPEQGLELLGHAMDSGRAQVAVLPIEWPRYLRRFGEVGAPKVLSGLLDEARAGMPRAQASPMRARLKGLPRGRQQELLLEHVHQQVAQVLGWDASAPRSGDLRLFDSGLDSLMAVELKNRLQASLGLERPLAATLVFEHPSIESLAEHLALEVFELGPLVPAPPAAPVEDTGPTLAELERRPEEELGSLLDEKLAALEKLMGES